MNKRHFSVCQKYDLLFWLLFDLSSVFTSVCPRIDSCMPGLLGAEEAVRLAKEELAGRIEPPARTTSNTSLLSLPASLTDVR